MSSHASGEAPLWTSLPHPVVPVLAAGREAIARKRLYNALTNRGIRYVSCLGNFFVYAYTVLRKRLIRDFRKLQTDPPHGVNGAPVGNDIMKWNAVIFGPEDTPWEGGTFQLEMIFSNEYPNRPPLVRFLSKLFHPNVYNDGNICLDILQTQWSPIYDISAILTSIQSLLSDPNPSSPANQEAARLYAENRREYNRRVQQCVNESWAAVPSEPSSETAQQSPAVTTSHAPPPPDGPAPAQSGATEGRSGSVNGASDQRHAEPTPTIGDSGVEAPSAPPPPADSTA